MRQLHVRERLLPERVVHLVVPVSVTLAWRVSGAVGIHSALRLAVLAIRFLQRTL